MNNSPNEFDLPGEIMFSEGGEKGSSDKDALNCYAYSGEVFDFFKSVFGRTSIDDNGFPLNLSVHFDRNFDNAFWTPFALSWAFGDGGGGFFKPGRMTDRSVVFHEYAHGITQYTAKFSYEEAGGLNESMSDVFSAMCEQKVNNQSFEQASWLIGEGIVEDSIGKALRLWRNPGNTSKTHRWDEQVQHYRDYSDDMDAHVCSGIPNKAFYLVCKNIGGNSWDKPGKIWYKALTSFTDPFCTFAKFASYTMQWAKTLYGDSEREAVKSAWEQVGVQVTQPTLDNAFAPNAKYR